MSAPLAPVDTSVLRLGPGPVDLRAIDADSAPGFGGDKSGGQKSLAAMGAELADLQERLWAARTVGDRRRVLLLLQGMDTSGKGGVIRNSLGLVDPQGLRIVAFKAPTEQEKQHDFLWRIRKGVPEAGYIGVFDRSHYEDVLIAKVHRWAAPEEIERRYTAINEFEAELAADGVFLIKCMLHVSAATQAVRLAERLARPDKYWKFNPGDLDERALWPEYQVAYQVALERTNTEHAPWHVIPAGKKWYRNLAVAQLLLDTLRALDLGWPAPEFDVAEQTARLAAIEVS